MTLCDAVAAVWKSDVVAAGILAPVSRFLLPAEASTKPREARSVLLFRRCLVVTTCLAVGLLWVGTAPSLAAAQPTIDNEAATGASASTVTLTAQINPQGTDTTYHFEYGPTTDYGTSVPAPDADIGPGSSDVSVSQTISGLPSSTMFHFRVVTTSSAGTVIGPDQIFATNPSVAPRAANSSACTNAQFRTGLGADLPDCRAYELVTPSDKNGAFDLFSFSNPGYSVASDDGDKVFLASPFAAFGPNPGSAENDYVFTRDSTGWALTNATPPGGTGNQYVTQIFNPSLTDLALQTHPLSEFTTSSSVAGPVGGPYARITGPEASGTTAFVGASSDFGHLVFESQDHSLAPGASGQVADSTALYQWTASGTSLVNVNSDGSLTSPCGAVLGDEHSNNGGDGNHNAVSADGSKIFFLSPDPTAIQNGASDPSCSQPVQLYVRDATTNTTVDISCPTAVPDPAGCQTMNTGLANGGSQSVGGYVGASSDGSKVFFITRTELTTDALATNNDPELYEYDTNTGALTRVSAGSTGSAAGDAIFGLPSEDGSVVYFAAWGSLAPGATAYSPNSINANLYRYDTVTGTTTFIAPIDAAIGGGNGWGEGSGYSTSWNVYSTPNGRFLLFSDDRAITGYDPSGGGAQHQELYRYDASGGGLSCVSCSPTGAPPLVGGGLGGFGATFNQVSTSTPDGRSPRPMSDDGSYVFFETNEQLVPRDSNQPLCAGAVIASTSCGDDVYEWHDGQLSLLSSGTSSQPTFFIDSSPNGHDVFFGTHAQLVPQDTDSQGDIYDARVNGGFAVPSTPAGCSGDGCQGSGSAPPSLPTVGTVTFSGPGNQNSSGRRPKARVIRKTVRGQALRLRVKVPSSGRITIGGTKLKMVSRRVARAGTYGLVVRLSARGRRELRRRHRLRVGITVTWRPSRGPLSSVHMTMTVGA